MPIRDWQIWNEPNLTRYWSTQPFAQLATCGCCRRRAARCGAADPGSRTILAGLPNESWIALRKIYKAGGRRRVRRGRAASVHRPAAQRDQARSSSRGARCASYGDGRKPVWLTELSWPASKGKTKGAPGFVTTERGQASRLKLALKLLAEARKRLRIERVVWYTWLSAARASDNSFDWSGLRRVRGDQLVTRAGRSASFRAAARRLAR